MFPGQLEEDKSLFLNSESNMSARIRTANLQQEPYDMEAESNIPDRHLSINPVGGLLRTYNLEGIIRKRTEEETRS